MHRIGACAWFGSVPVAAGWLSLSWPGGGRQPGKTDVKELRMTSREFTTWRKSSYSGGDSNCMEIGTRNQAVGVRDTQQLGRGPVLEFPSAAWRAFIITHSADRV
jgi:hypothetical protein